MDIGIAFDLRTDFAAPPGAPVDRLEEYDSRETVDAIAAALAALGHAPRLLGGGRRFVEAVLARPPELVFNIAEGWGTRSREAHVPALCEMLGIAFTHSDPLTLALTLDKAMTKRVIASHGLRTAPFAVVERANDLARIDLPFPLFAKPAFEGSSMGIRATSRVTDERALAAEVTRLLRDYAQPVLVETFLPGAELTVGVLGNGTGAWALGTMEITPRDGNTADFVYGLETKRDFRRAVTYHSPARTASLAAVFQSERIAVEAFQALGCRDVARVDFRLDAAGLPNFVEINPLPGLSPTTSDLVILANLVGETFESLIGRIVEAALRRLPQRSGAS